MLLELIISYGVSITFRELFHAVQRSGHFVATATICVIFCAVRHAVLSNIEIRDRETKQHQ